MNLRLITAFALLALALTGCGHTDPVVRYKYAGQLPPLTLVQDCKAAPPPAKEIYLSSAWSEREKLLSKSLQQSHQLVAVCNTALTELRDWRSKQEKLIRELEAQPAK